MSDSENPKPRKWLPIEPPPPRAPDAVIIPEGQLADVLPDGLVEALEKEDPGVALDPQWAAARDAFLASMNKDWGGVILKELSKEIARRKDGAQESAKDMCQKVWLILSRRFTEHVLKTGKAWEPNDPGPYVRGVARNVALNHFTMKARKPMIARGVEVDDMVGLGLDPEEEARHRQLLEILERERGALTTEEAEVFECRMSHEMTFAAIAAVFRRSVSTVYDQYRSAVKKLEAIVERVF